LVYFGLHLTVKIQHSLKTKNKKWEFLNNININRVLVAPLDWGLGHATRCIPIIRAFHELEIEVIIAAEGTLAILLKAEFPNIRIIPLKGYHIQYAKTSAGLFWKLLTQVPRIICTIRKEHIWLQHIIQEEKIDLVISDNRYGLYSDQIPCILITHQLTIKVPIHLVEQLLQKLHYHFINRFFSCWIPDAAGEKNIAGVLSHPKILPKIPVHYMGIISRMQSTLQSTFDYQYCFLLSGPEPQRTMIETQILSIVPQLSGSVILVRGLPATLHVLKAPNNLRVLNHVSTEKLAAILVASELIICRSGYTSVMELIGLHKKALLIPTPGQTEQKYLAEKLQSDQRFFMSKQNGLNLLSAIETAKQFPVQYAEIAVFSTKVLEALLLEF
jgi:uncharacterized protein (TIGR00661 family)